MSSYKPIACGLHDQYQLAVLKKRSLVLEWEDEYGGKLSAVVLPRDVFTRDKAEYLRAIWGHEKEIEIRLDYIRKANWAHDGMPLV